MGDGRGEAAARDGVEKGVDEARLLGLSGGAPRPQEQYQLQHCLVLDLSLEARPRPILLLQNKQIK